MADRDSFDLRESLLENAGLIDRLNRLVVPQLASSGYSGPAIRILVALDHAPMSQGAMLAYRLGMSSAQLSREVKALFEDGLVSREPSARDKRSFLLRLTPKGQEAAAELKEARLAAVDVALARMPARDRRALQDVALYQQKGTSAVRDALGRPAEPPDVVSALTLLTGSLPARLGRDPGFLAYAARAMAIICERWPSEDYSGGFVEADEHEELIGFCFLVTGSFDAADVDQADATLFGPFVSSPYARRGLGTRMLTQCINEAREMTYAALSVRIPGRNAEFSQLLIKHNFQRARAEAEELSFAEGEAWITYTRMLGRWSR